MESLPINVFDIAVVVVLIVGALIGLAVGFVRGGLFVLSWLGAALVTIFGFATARPYARQYIENQLFADLAAGATLFVVTLVILFLISSVLGGWVRSSRLNALDRSLGMIFGLATTAAILAVAYIAMEQVWPPAQQPKWIQDARSLPLIRSAAKVLNGVLPEDFKLIGETARDKISEKARKLEQFEKLRRSAIDTDGAGAKNLSGYGKKARKELERVIQSTK
ncbi:MAG: CvpA family protein [Rhodospirillales bacterium]|nr:CvpA family protein [Rhodospirillales bacterium]